MLSLNRVVFIFSSIFVLNIPVSILIDALICLTGITIYAYYRNCDPLRAGKIQNFNQVREFVPFCVAIHCARRGLDIIIVSATASELSILAVLSLGVALRTGQSGASEAAERCIFLSSIWFGFAGHVVLLWSWFSRRGRGTAPVDSEIQGEMCEMLGISLLKGHQVETLEPICPHKRDTFVCVLTRSRNSACFEVIRTVMDHVTGRERAA